jgi:hypothetical protein
MENRRPRAVDFVKATVEAAVKVAPKRFGPYSMHLRAGIGQIYTGSPALHYEVWRRARLGVTELGLHFEADALTNARLLGAFRAREAEVRTALGAEPVLEEWDKGWARIYEARALSDDRSEINTCARRLATYIAALEPILRDELPADVRWRPERGRVRAPRARR